VANSHLGNNSYAPSTNYFGPSYNKGENKHDWSNSQIFLDDRFRSGSRTTPILARILVVDDEPDINLIIKKMLERQSGFVVDAFDDPDSALRNFTPGLYGSIT
jgi:hypothetical protein